MLNFEAALLDGVAFEPASDRDVNDRAVFTVDALVALVALVAGESGDFLVPWMVLALLVAPRMFPALLVAPQIVLALLDPADDGFFDFVGVLAGDCFDLVGVLRSGAFFFLGFLVVTMVK